MSKADWAVARHALTDALPPAAIGLAAGWAMLSGALESLGDIKVPAHSTWPLVPLVVVAAWAGIGVFGELRGTMAHMLARPLHRARLLGIRALVNAVILGIASAIIQWMSSSEGAVVAGPPFAFVVGLALVAFGVGTVSGACAATESGAVGGTLVGLALIVAPVMTLVDLYAVSWPRLVSAFGGWVWPVALFGGAGLVWPVWHVVRRLPQRPPQRAVAAVVGIAALHVLALAVIWQPAASRATMGVHGDLVAIDGVVGGPRVVYTATDGKVDGVYVQRGEQRVQIYGEGARRSQIVDAEVSPDGCAIALLVRPFEDNGRRIVLVDLHAGNRMETEVEMEMSLGAWSPDSKEMAFIVAGKDPWLGVANLSDATVREIPSTTLEHHSYGRILGWHRSSLVVFDRAGLHKTLHLVPTTGEDTTRSFELSTYGPPAISAAGFAWVRKVWRREANSSDPRRILTLQGWEPGMDPIEVDLQGWAGSEVTGLGFLDDEHVYAELAERGSTAHRGSPKRPKRLFIVHRSGEIRGVIEREHGYNLHSLSGPPQGPWLATEVYGRVGRLHPDGQLLPKAVHSKNLGTRSERWIPMRHIPSGVQFIRRGRPVLVTLTDEEGAR